jgi:predicted esterase
VSNPRLTDRPSAGDPHAGQRVVQQGAPLAHARMASILLHGRGGSPEDMLSLADEWRVSDVAYLAPAASNHTWYPQPFLAPIARNEPALSSALRMLERLVGSLDVQGIGPDRVLIVGFSQGACLGLEYVARHAKRYGGVVGLSGGLIGPPGLVRNDVGSLGGTPVFLGCSDVDPHIPLERVHESAETFRRLGGIVDERIYRGMGHTVNGDEMHAVRALLRQDASTA